ncbi:MAG: NADH-quinone oxidoreductase subunit A [Saprospiraceae bacterium]|nr:NADH-quinone oxidoreductase subunit A [Saprospiraceae bacterium]MBP7699841.1 NADH-quinone oxidoreductase subunit A [Saprospiraceae bacterium]
MSYQDYFPIVIQALVALGFVFFVLGATHLLGPKRKSEVKNENFECGIESEGNARIPVSIKYFMTAILFVLFDVEVVFFYPYAVNFKEMGTQGFFAVVAFVAVFLLGFFYVLKKGALEWER